MVSDIDHAHSGVVCYLMVNSMIWPTCVQKLKKDMKEDPKRRNMGRSNSERLGNVRSSAISPFDRAHTTFYLLINSVPFSTRRPPSGVSKVINLSYCMCMWRTHWGDRIEILPSASENWSPFYST